MSGKGHRVPIDVLDGIGDVAIRTGELAEAIECAHVAASFKGEDCGEFVGGTLAVLLREADEVFGMASGLLSEAKGAGK
ncbi:MAG: hypothetical protein RRZ85_06275 [Gordonibacter sp.]|uniref:hypothetical protein n=1 Tax=Gordonibacter sp. TaxID=1968902 RepID=UPI002FCC2105